MLNMQVKINQLGVLFCALFFLYVEPLVGQSKPLLTSPQVENPKSILFIGNSFFYYNNGVHKPVLGMVKVFQNMSNDGFQIGSLSAGIMEAMITTVGGLIVGIVAYIAYNYLVSKVEKVIQNMEGASIEFIDILEAPGNS